MDYFDRFFVFDPNDIADENVLPLTNFYTNSFKIQHDKAFESDACYVGTYMSRRIGPVEEIVETLNTLGLTVTTHVYSRRKNRQAINGMDISARGISSTHTLLMSYPIKV